LKEGKRDYQKCICSMSYATHKNGRVVPRNLP
jgi:hypothetical protein